MALPGERTDLVCLDCGEGRLSLKTSKVGTLFYGCSNFPTCRGSHSAVQKTGAPMGVVANKATRVARVHAHEVFDRIWKRKLVPSRHDAYKWMREHMKLSHSKAHISMMSKEQCETLVALTYAKFPALHTYYSRLLMDDLEEQK